MSDVREVLPVLLGVERESDRLVVSVDLDPESTAPGAESILTLTFEGCSPTVEARAELDDATSALTESVGSPIEWNTAAQADAEFYIDYGAVWCGVTYASMSERREAPSAAYLHRRVAKLAEWTDELTRRFNDLDRRYTALSRELEREAEREADRAARKLPFLRERGSASVHVVEARAAAFERVNQIVHQNRGAPE
jgi:hypothetical protein